MYAIDLQGGAAAARTTTRRTRSSAARRPRSTASTAGCSATRRNIVISEDRKTAYVVNHHGAIDNDEFLQHGGRGNIAVMDIGKMIAAQATTTPPRRWSATSTAAGSARVGLVLLQDMFVIGNAESHLTEDGGNRITFVDRKTGSLRGAVELLRAPERNCPRFRCRCVSPSGPPTFEQPFLQPNGTLSPVPLLSPHPAWGCFPDTNGIALGTRSDGKRYLFTANGGTDDVSVIDLEAALAGNKTAGDRAHSRRRSGPWGIATSPDGRWVVAANRESQQDGVRGQHDLDHRRRSRAPRRRRRPKWRACGWAPATRTSRRGRSCRRSRPTGK